MKRNGSVRRLKVSADGEGVVSHAGMAMLRELAGYTGLVRALDGALADTYRGPWLHSPGRVLTDVAVAVADGADAITGIAVLGDRQDVFGPVASMPTAWRVLDRVDAVHLPAVRAARAVARERAWAAGAGPDLSEELCIDFDATITVAHSEKENAAATWKRTFGFHPLLAFLDRPEVAGGEALAGLLRAGNAGSNTATDHVTVLEMAIAALPEQARPRPGDPDSPQVLARSDSAGATHTFAAACREEGVGFSFGFPVDFRIKDIVDAIPETAWYPAIETHGMREGAWVAEVTDNVDLSAWPAGSRLILRKGTPPSWRAVNLHRHRRHADHRVLDRHPARRGPRPARRPGAAPPSARPRGGPHPPSQGHRSAQPAVPGLERERRLARGRLDGRRPDHLDQADRLR